MGEFYEEFLENHSFSCTIFFHIDILLIDSDIVCVLFRAPWIRLGGTFRILFLEQLRFHINSVYSNELYYGYTKVNWGIYEFWQSETSVWIITLVYLLRTLFIHSSIQ